MEKLLNKRQVAEILGVSVHSINRIAREVGYVMVGRRRILFDPRDVEDYIKRRKFRRPAR
ncbi:MAG: helix-turn-helix domain-containing protein [Deltaproteobacteria bacterium]|nr:helix-turn-helix domain-containing protein [Deltaproteobacteria bacterium]